MTTEIASKGEQLLRVAEDEVTTFDHWVRVSLKSINALSEGIDIRQEVRVHPPLRDGGRLLYQYIDSWATSACRPLSREEAVRLIDQAHGRCGPLAICCGDVRDHGAVR